MLLHTRALAVVTGVATCIVTELAGTEGGIPDRVCPLVPGEIAWDNCECGQLAQTITAITPTKIFPQPAIEDQSRCDSTMLMVNVTTSLVRCAPTINDNGENPTCDELFTAARILEEDRFVLRKAIRCCLADFTTSYVTHNFAIGPAVSVGPNGMCVGVDVTWQFTVSYLGCCD